MNSVDVDMLIEMAQKRIMDLIGEKKNLLIIIERQLGFDGDEEIRAKYMEFIDAMDRLIAEDANFLHTLQDMKMQQQ